MAANKNISLFMVMFSALNLLLARITGQQDIMTGIAAAGREHAALQPIVGFFVSSIIFISHVNPDGPFADFLDRMEKNTLEVLQNQDYPFELVIENLKMRFPKIPVMFNMLNMGDGYEPGVETLSHPREPYHIETVQDVKFQQELYVSQYKNAIEIQVHYRKALFKPATIEYMMGEYKKLLDFIMENPLETLNDYGKSSNKQKFSRRPKPGKC
jgi:non-ribosomal peptide synthetase component F